MSTKTFFTREQILTTAFELLKDGGAASLSARSLAKALGSSTMPIYSAIGDMETLKGELAIKVHEIILEYQKRGWTDNVLLNLAVGYVKFAQENPRLFDFFASVLKMEARFENAEVPDISKQPFAEFRNAFSQPDKVIFNIWVYIHGLAQLIASGIISATDQEIIADVQHAGGAFYTFNARPAQGAESGGNG